MDHPRLYDEICKELRQTRGTYLDEFVPSLSWPLEGRVTVLDVGCGPGSFAAEQLLPRLPASRISRLVCVDVLHNMVRYANDTYSVQGTLEYHLMDVANPRIERTAVFKAAAPFSKIFSFYCLHWIQDQRLAVKNLYKLLSDEGGEMVLFVIAKYGTGGAYLNLSKKPRWSRYMQDAERYELPFQKSVDPAKDYRNLLEDEGLDVDICRCDNHYDVFTSIDDVRDLIAAINPFLNRIPLKDQSDFIDDCIGEFQRTKYLLSIKQEDLHGGIKYMFHNTVIVVKARK